MKPIQGGVWNDDLVTESEFGHLLRQGYTEDLFSLANRALGIQCDRQIGAISDDDAAQQWDTLVEEVAAWAYRNGAGGIG